MADRREHVAVSRRGRPAAVLVPVDEYEALEETAEILSDEPTLDAIRRGLDDLAAGEIVALDEVCAEHGVPGVPKPHGLDRDGREVLEFLPGQVPSHPMPRWVWNDDRLAAAARWQLPDHPPVEVICDNDFAPCNMIFDVAHRLVGVIDFDTCSPGSRVWDLAYLAYRMVPFHAPGTLQTPPMDAGQRIDRLGRLGDAYGPPAQPDDILAMLERRVRDLDDFTAVRTAAAGPASELHSHLSSCEVDLAYLDELTTDEKRPCRSGRKLTRHWCTNPVVLCRAGSLGRQDTGQNRAEDHVGVHTADPVRMYVEDHDEAAISMTSRCHRLRSRSLRPTQHIGRP